MNRPPLEKLRRIAQRGIDMEVPQATDMAKTIDYALHLESALDLIRRLCPADPQAIAADAPGTSNVTSESPKPTPEATAKGVSTLRKA